MHYGEITGAFPKGLESLMNHCIGLGTFEIHPSEVALQTFSCMHNPECKMPMIRAPPPPIAGLSVYFNLLKFGDCYDGWDTHAKGSVGSSRAAVYYPFG